MLWVEFENVMYRWSACCQQY